MGRKSYWIMKPTQNDQVVDCVWLILFQFTVPLPVHINYRPIHTYRKGFKTVEFHLLCVTEVMFSLIWITVQRCRCLFLKAIQGWTIVTVWANFYLASQRFSSCKININVVMNKFRKGSSLERKRELRRTISYHHYLKWSVFRSIPTKIVVARVRFCN
jgi:hypothetical protein